MRYPKLFLIVTLMIMSAISVTIAQEVTIPIPDAPEVTQLTNWYNYIYALLVMLWGVIAKLAGWKVERGTLVLTVIAGGVVMATAFIWFGVMDSIPALVMLLSSMGIYDTILGLINLISAKKQKDTVKALRK